MIQKKIFVILTVLFLTGAGCSVSKQNDSGAPANSPAGNASGSTGHAGELHSGGEADPARMTLTMKEWAWIRTQYNNDTTLEPAKPGTFTLSFSSDGRLSATTDCNRMSGGYNVYNNRISFSQLASTRMYCPDSQEGTFADMLSHVSSFLFTPKGELILELKYDSGHILFK